LFPLILLGFELLVGLELRLRLGVLGQFSSLLGHHLSLLLQKLFVMLPEFEVAVAHRGGVLRPCLSLFGGLWSLGRYGFGLLENGFFRPGGLNRRKLGGLLGRLLNNWPKFFGIAMRGNHMSIFGLIMMVSLGRMASMGVTVFDRLFLLVFASVSSSVPVVFLPLGLGVSLSLRLGL